MVDRIAEAGAVQQAITDADASVAKPSGLGAAGWIAGQVVDIKTAGYTGVVSGLTGKGRLINKYVLNGGGGGGTSADRYSVAGTNFRWPVDTASNATNTYMAVEWYFGTPDYSITDPRVFCPSFYSPSAGGETYLAAGASITVQGWAVETSAGVWTACDGATETGVATVTNATAGAWLPRIAATLTKNTVYRARMTFVVSATGVSIPRNTAQAAATAPGGQSRTEGSTTTRIARLTSTGSNLSNSGGVFYAPSMLIAKGGDGRKAMLILGDSIGYGVADTLSPAAWNARNEFGYIPRALDDMSTTKRLAFHNMSIPGQRPCGTAGWDVEANWAGKIAALQMVYDAYGAWPFDEIISQHITNAVPYSADGGDLRVGMSRYYDVLIAKFAKPIYQVECLGAATSTDGYATTANQTPQTGYVYGSSTPGHAWPFNADVGGADGLGDASAYYRANGKIAGSIAPWRYVAQDTANDRDIYPVQAFSTTLSSAYVSGTSIVTVAAPTVGMALKMLQDSGSYGTTRMVTAVSGTGPYTVTLSGTAGTAAAIGKTVRAVWGDDIHPAPVMHAGALVTSIVDWKTARGFV